MLARSWWASCKLPATLTMFTPPETPTNEATSISTNRMDLPSGLHSGRLWLRCKKTKWNWNIGVFIEKKSEQQPFSSSVTTTAKLPVWAAVGGATISAHYFTTDAWSIPDKWRQVSSHFHAERERYSWMQKFGHPLTNYVVCCFEKWKEINTTSAANRQWKITILQLLNNAVTSYLNNL